MEAVATGYSAVVTGAASGIGKAIAMELAGRGYKVIVADIEFDRAARVASEIGAASHAVACDVGDADAVERLADEAERFAGTIDLVFANAGVSMGGQLLECQKREFDWIFATNVWGPLATARAFAKRMIANGCPGRLCITGSEHSLGFQHAGAGLYTASKHAVLGLAEVLRSELPESIDVSILCPGLATTDIYRSRRNSELPPETDIALAVGREVMSMGMNPDEVARRAVDGVLAAEFIIPTHGPSIKAARKRWTEIELAFARQAPESAADDYDIGSIFATAIATVREKP